MNHKNVKPMILALSATFVSTALAQADSNAADPFQLTDMEAGYQLAENSETDKESKLVKEGNCGEGKCGGSHGGKSDKEGQCGESGAKGEDTQKLFKEGKCGEGKCGGSQGGGKSDAEGSCGESGSKKEDSEKLLKEGKCGEGKCGGSH